MALNSSSSKDFKFTLRDDELLRFLYNKIHNKSLPNYITILEYDLFGTLKNPWDIWEEFGASRSYCEKDLYFFTTLNLEKKSTTSSKLVRSIGIGAWEGEEDTGKIIVAKNKNQLIGVKKCFRFENSGTYHDGEWILHEYSLDKSLIRNPLANNYVLCRFRKNIDAQGKERKTIVPRRAETTISGNKDSLTKYIIYKEPRNESNGGHNGTNMINTKSQYKEEEKDVRNIWPRETAILGLEAANKFENIDQNPIVQPDNEDDDDDGECIVDKEDDDECIENKEDDDDGMTWPEIFAKQLIHMNEGCLLEEEEVHMIPNKFHEELLLDNTNIK